MFSCVLDWCGRNQNQGRGLARGLQVHVEHIAVEKVSEALHFLVHW